jgi:hypothetical protein
MTNELPVVTKIPVTPKVACFIGMPTYNGEVRYDVATRGQNHATNDQGNKLCVQMYEGGSSLPQVYNKLWIQGLGSQQPRFTHWAMLHADLLPDAYWVDTLYNVMQETGATIVSAVAAIKDSKGVTSTAVGPIGDDFTYRRLTVSELEKLPETFGIEEVKAAGMWQESEFDDACLLVNTGCMLVDMSWEPWFAMQPDGITMAFCMEQKHRIQKWPNGQWNPEFAPEDWLMSRYVAKYGGKCVATTKVKTVHVGTYGYPSTGTWGGKTDVEVDRFREQKRAAFSEAATNDV